MKEKIELLAVDKGFGALSAAERALVLSEMPQEEFEHLRMVLLATRQMDAGVQPSARLRAQLLEKMAAQPKPSLVWKVPIWQAAVVLLLSIVAVWLLKPEIIREKTVTEILVRTDTVWQVKTVWRDRVVWRERVVYRAKPDLEPIAMFPEKADNLEISVDFSPPEFAAPRVGTSMGDAPELMRFFTQGDK